MGFTQISHPLAIGLSLLIQTILIFLGGILVLFIYITSLASNEIFKPSITLIIFALIIFPLRLIIINIDNIVLPQINSFSTPSSSKITPYLPDISLTAIVYNPINFNLTIFIVFYLLLTLIVVVKVTNIFFGPLRLIVN